MIRTIPFTIVLGVLALFAHTAQAATLFFTPGTGEFGIGKEISADLKIDSEGVGINAGQATIRFPKDILEVKSVNKAESTFNFWLEEPAFSNTDGVITFVGGTPYGVSGASIQVLHVVFTTKSAGTGLVNIIDAAVTASDGSGTNVLSKTNDAAFTVSPASTPATITPATITAPLAVTPPVQIKREPVAPVGLPAKPVLSVSLYPVQGEWSNRSNIFTVSWALPLDIVGVATALNKQPNYTGAGNEGLFDSKAFEALADGIWYLHVQFKNDIGWGPTAHYRIAVDTKAPLPFELTSDESDLSDNPAPVFNFGTNDSLSGLREYRLRVDNGEWTSVPVKGFKGSYKMPNQTPGKHRLLIQAVDNANNSIEDTIEYEILPLVSPTFTFVTEKLFSDEVKGLSMRGTGLPGTEILLALKKGEAIVTSKIAPVDANGNWEFTSSDLLLSGKYVATIQNRDARGALSLVVTAPEIQVAGRYTDIAIVVLVILVSALVAGAWIYKTRRERTKLRIQVAERDTANVFKMIESDIEKLKNAQGTATTIDEEFIAKKLGENVKKMGSYIKDEIGRAKE